MKRIDQTETLQFSPFWHWSALVLFLLPTIALVTSIFTYIDIVAQGVGRVVPVSSVRPVDSQLSGEIVEVLVAPGAFVKEGDAILKLDETELRNALLKGQQKIEQLLLESSRLRAAIGSAEVYDPIHPEFERFAVSLFNLNADVSVVARKVGFAKLRAELNSLTANISEIDANVEALMAHITGIEAQIVKAKSVLESETANIAAARKLVLTKNITNTEYRRRLQEFESATSEVAVSKQNLSSKTAEVHALKQRRKSLVTNITKDWYAAVEAADVLYNEQNLELSSLKRRLELLVVKAPATGRIEEFKVRTVGARVDEGQTIARIVPTNDAIEIEAKIPSGESSFLKEQQKVVINLDAYPSERFGTVVGQIRTISADTIQESTTGWHYVLRISPSTSFLTTNVGKVELSPGMTVSVNVVTGNRRMISYFFEPILKTLLSGGREP